MKLLLAGCEHRVSQALTARLDAPEFDLLPLTTAELERIEFKNLFIDEATQRPFAIISTPVISPLEPSFRRRLQLTDVYKKLCAFANAQQLPLLHLSSTHVFNGLQARPYTEQDAPLPQNIEAQVWRRWETLIQKLVPQHIVIRPGWILSHDAEQLAAELLLFAAMEDEVDKLLPVRVNPTSAEDLARVLDAILRQLAAGAQAWGLYHYAGKDITNTKTLLRNAQSGPLAAHDAVKDLRIADDHEELNACLDSRKILYAFGIQQHPWSGAMHPSIKDPE